MPRAPSPGPSDSDSDQNSASEVEEEFEVDAILAERETKRGGKPVTEFLVAWKPTNGQKWDDTWEPEENLQNSMELIAAFRRKAAGTERTATIKTKKAESKPGTPVKSASKDKDNEKKEVKEKKPAKKREASPVLPAPVSEKKKTPVKKRALEEDEEKQEPAKPPKKKPAAAKKKDIETASDSGSTKQHRPEPAKRYLYTSELPSDLQNTKSWDPLIDRVESMWTEDGDIDGPCIFLNWKNGINSVNTVEEVRQKAPQVLLEYCLGRIKFKTSGGRLLNWLGEEVTL